MTSRLEDFALSDRAGPFFSSFVSLASLFNSVFEVSFELLYFLVSHSCVRVASRGPLWGNSARAGRAGQKNQAWNGASSSVPMLSDTSRAFFDLSGALAFLAFRDVFLAPFFSLARPFLGVVLAFFLAEVRAAWRFFEAVDDFLGPERAFFLPDDCFLLFWALIEARAFLGPMRCLLSGDLARGDFFLACFFRMSSYSL